MSIPERVVGYLNAKTGTINGKKCVTINDRIMSAEESLEANLFLTWIMNEIAGEMGLPMQSNVVTAKTRDVLRTLSENTDSKDYITRFDKWMSDDNRLRLKDIMNQYRCASSFRYVTIADAGRLTKIWQGNIADVPDDIANSILVIRDDENRIYSVIRE